MILQELIANLNQIDEELTIYIEANLDWNPKSKVKIEIEPLDGHLPVDIRNENMEYFLEVSLAKEVLAEWANWQGMKITEIPIQKRCQIVIYYAKNDAYLPA